jgi:hypothetical protein
LLAAGCFLSFRARRDVYFVVVAAVAIITTLRSTEPAADRFAMTKLRALLVTGGVAVLLVVVGWTTNFSERHLEAMVAKKFPVAATAIVEKHGYPGPLYNHFDWGSYLIWRLPNLPVTMDGRANLHGDERIKRSLATWTGKKSWASDPELATARLVIANTNQALASLLRSDPRFELIHEDEVAAVFVATPQRKGQ